MIFSLFLKECRIILKSITFYIVALCIMGFVLDQVRSVEIKKPKPNEKSYGTKITTDTKVMIDETIENLIGEYARNDYQTYPVGFEKRVHLNKDKQAEVAKFIELYTGYKDEQIKKQLKDDEEDSELKVKKDINYSQFVNDMKKVDKILGGGSRYSEDSIKSHARVPRTYDDAIKDYNSLINKDHISDAYARLFCDYEGIALAILPIFLAVTRCISDRKSKAQDTIYASRASSFSIIVSRYAAVVIMLLIPVIISAVLIDSQCIYCANTLGVQPDYLSFTKHILGWILPTLMFTVAVGFFFTELTGKVIGILVQAVYWFVSLNANSAKDLVGRVGWNLIPRFNGRGARNIFIAVYDQLVINRICYAGVSIVLIILTVIIFNLKRNGRLMINGRGLSNIKSKLKA